MLGRTLGHYTITGEIGCGGMGVVYRARDALLNRDVAVKVLGEDPARSGLGHDHLLEEARAASALNHPNICTIYEVGEQDGRFYIVMELVEGRPFGEMIGPLRAYTKGSAQVVIHGGFANLREALVALCAEYPGGRDRVLTEEGEVRQHVNVFVGNDCIRYGRGLSTPLRDGDTISIVPAITGGRPARIAR
ncbi:MAG TPA: MoaD/ThiS family protein [Candidatus Cybelea sp.]|nr:MoaD/ThiS family protein [Candidatus Cybelea sp.]